MVGGQRHIFSALPSGKRPVTHCTRRWASGPVWTGAENLAPPGFDPRAAKPVPSHYTDCAILAHTQSVKDEKRLWSFSRVYCERCLEVTERTWKMSYVHICPLRLKSETCNSRYRYFTLFVERLKALPPSYKYSLYSLWLLFLWPLYLIPM